MLTRTIQRVACIVPLLLLANIVLADAPTTAPSYDSKSNIAYRTETSDAYATERCHLDIYYPAGVNDFPTVIFFHGGGLTGGERFTPEELKNKGVAVVAVSYRLAPKAKVVDCLDDAAAAVAWTFTNIEQFGGDKKKIFVSGHSAGAYLTLMLGFDKTWLAKYDIDANDIAGLISLSSQAITHMQARAEHGIPATQPVVDDLSPLYHLRKDAPPTLLITGDRELELNGRYEENAYLWRMLHLAGHTRNKLYELQGFDHGGMAVPAYPLLLQFVKNGWPEHGQK